MNKLAWKALFILPIATFIILIIFIPSDGPTDQLFKLPIKLINIENFKKEYRINYKILYDPQLCNGSKTFQEKYYCFSHQYFTDVYPPNLGCRHYIKGLCKSDLFKAGIENFITSSEKLNYYKEILKEKRPYLLLSITPKGEVEIKDIISKK
jgi:hypothetical protein